MREADPKGQLLLFAFAPWLSVAMLPRNARGKKQGFSTNGHTRNWGFPQNPQAPLTQTPLVSYRNND